MPRVTKTKAAVAATPRRATRSSVRAGSATLEEPVAIPPTPRRGRSRSVTPTHTTAESSFQSQSSVEHLPALTEEEEKQPSPHVIFPEPAEFAPLVEASPYITPRHHHSATPSRASPSVNHSRSAQQSVAVYIDDDENDDPVQAQIAAETQEAGWSSPKSLRSSNKRKRSTPTVNSSSKRRSVDQTNSLPHSSDRSVVRTPLSHVSGNAASPFTAFPHDISCFTPSPKTPAPLPLMERALNSVTTLQELTHVERTALLMEMRKEIMRLRKVEEQFLAGNKPSPKSSPSPRQDSSPEVPRTINRSRDLRFQMSIAKPALKNLAARQAADEAAAAAAAAEQTTSQSQLDQTPSRSSAPTSSNGKRKSKTPQSKTPEPQTPEKSSQSSVSAETPSASPAWGLTSLFGTVKKAFSLRTNPSPEKQSQDREQRQPAQQPEQQSQHQPEQKKQKIRVSALGSPATKSKTRTMPKSPAPPATPTPNESSFNETPRTTRRLGRLPDSVRPVRNRDTPRRKPKETNADLRNEQLEKAAEQTAERKRLQEQADKIEQERRKVEEEQKQRDAEDLARSQAGNKRKRVRIDDLKVIPSRRPGQGSGTFGLVDDFFDYNSDEEDDYVEMDEDEIELIDPPARPAKKVRLNENVFQPKAPAVQPPAVSPVKQTAAPPSAPATPGPNLNLSHVAQQAIDRQRLQFSQHKPKQPSRLRNVERLSTGSTIAGDSPRQSIIAPPQLKAAPPQQTAPPAQQVSPVSQLPKTPPQKTFTWPAGEPMETPETWARIDLLYTAEMRAADHEYFMKGLAAVAANGY